MDPVNCARNMDTSPMNWWLDCHEEWELRTCSKSNMLSNLVEPVTLFVSTGLWGSLQALSTGRHRKICHSKLYAWTVSFRNVWPTMSLEHGTTNGRFLLNIRTQHSQQRCFLRFFFLAKPATFGAVASNMKGEASNQDVIRYFGTLSIPSACPPQEEA